MNSVTNEDCRHDCFVQETDEYGNIGVSFRKCDFCGYDILPDQEAVKAPTGDILHRSCWGEYAEDNCFCICEQYISTE